ATTPTSLLHADRAGASLTIEVVRDAAAAGDAVAQAVVAETGRYLGIAVASLVGTLNIRRIILVGGITTFGRPLLQAVRQEMVRHALPQQAQETEVRLADGGPDIVIEGAGALVLARELGLSLAR
ncbi:MAG TPA: ROK family protein, partial [Chloroflexia bacterium]|nr:ROK family protein [Chloroflexia bacterium]